MGNRLIVLLAFSGVILFSCGSNDSAVQKGDNPAQNAIEQKQDGTISLDVKKADTYHDVNNPETNTAEWNVMVSKSGRYDIWLSSATRDSSDLSYDKTVLLSISDNVIEAKPSIDKIIKNTSDVTYPYTADSFMGSLFIQETGLYNIQVISDKIIPDESQGEETKLISVSLTPSVD
jgi:hypothetical protein